MSREEELTRRAEMFAEETFQRWAPAEDPGSVSIALRELHRATRRHASREDRPVEWKIRARQVGDEILLWADCLGHTDVHYVSRTLESSPLVSEPRDFAGVAGGALGLEALAVRTQSMGERLADGFAMLDGYESAARRREELRWAQ